VWMLVIGYECFGRFLGGQGEDDEEEVAPDLSGGLGESRWHGGPRPRESMAWSRTRSASLIMMHNDHNQTVLSFYPPR